MAARQIFYVGNTGRIGPLRDTSPDGSNIVDSAVKCSVFLSDPAAPTINNQDGEVDNSSPAPYHDFWYTWDPVTTTPGLYTAILSRTRGTERLSDTLEVLVWPLFSEGYDPLIRLVKSFIQEIGLGEDLQQLSLYDYQVAIDTATLAYSKDWTDQRGRIYLGRPENVSVDFNATTGTLEYVLSTSLPGWQVGFSKTLRFVYPVDATTGAETTLTADQYRIDELRDRIRFIGVSPATGQSARIEYTRPYTLRHAALAGPPIVPANPIPVSDRTSVAKYAAGEALLMLAGAATRMNEPGIGADVIGTRDLTQRRTALAKEWMLQARELWDMSALEAGMLDPEGLTIPSFFTLAAPGVLARGR